MPAKTPKRPKLPAKPLGGSNFPDDDLIARVERGIAATFGSPLMELVQKFGFSVEDTIRFHLISKKCREERERAGLSIKDAARRLSVPQYRIRAVESVEIRNVAPMVLRNYLDLLGLTDWYSEWAHANAELARRFESGIANEGHQPAAPETRAIPAPIAEIMQSRTSRRQSEEAISFHGQVIAVKARIRLIRSFDQISHQYQGYTLVLAGLNPEPVVVRVAIGPAAHAKHQFRIGDVISGKAQPVPDPRLEWATLYKASGLKVESRGPTEQARPADPDGGVAAPLEVYRVNGHRRLDPHTYQAKCFQCPWGLIMPTEIIVDQWNQSKVRWRRETHCYGPRDCPRYRAGAARKVPGRKSGMVWVNNDVERESERWPRKDRTS
jgi:transcriptional regulator with XRE-family HTH domain